MSLLQIESASISFGGVQALSDIWFSVNEGERRAIVGPNGAGKSTLFNVIGGQLRPSSGKILFRDRNIATLPVYARAQAGLARTWQITNLFDPLSVYECIQIAIASKGTHRRVFWRSLDSYTGIRAATEALLTEWELWEIRDKPVQDLAYGQQRLLEIVVALSGNPVLLLMDEPTAGLSPTEAERLTDLIRQLPNTMTLIIIEHDMAVAYALAQTMTVLSLGRVLAQGPIDEVRANPEVVEVYLGSDSDN